MTLLTISQNILKRNKSSELPTAIISNPSDTAKLVFSAVRDATYIVKEATNWQVLTKTHSFQSAASQQAYALPSDIEDTKILANTFWNATTRFQLEGPITLTNWQLLLNWPLISTIIQNFIILQNEVNIYPVPTSIADLSYLYITNQIIRANDTSPQDDWLADNDYSILNEYAIELQGSWIYLKQLGRPYEEEQLKADKYLEGLVKQDASRGTINTNMSEIRPLRPNVSWLGAIIR
jgi:hypothetical protein